MSDSKRACSASTTSSADTGRTADKKARTELALAPSDSGYPTVSRWHPLSDPVPQTVPHADSPEPMNMEIAKPASNETTADATPATTVTSEGGKPIAECFTAWIPPAHLTTVPPVQPTWGIKPFPTESAGPQPHPNSPAARTSNAATNPPLWEDRKFPFVAGRYHKSFGPGPIPTDSTAVDLDQEENLVLRLIDMRPIRSGPNKGAPRRQPLTWHFRAGKPKDWTDVKQTLHAMNTRRRDNLRAITCDPPWTFYEREYLAQLFQDYPNASITELAERHNYLFTTNFREGPLQDTTDFALHQVSAKLSTGRTIESFRHEYLTWKHVYDAGEVPNPARDEKHKKVDSEIQAHLDAFERDWDPAVDTGEPGYPAGYVVPQRPSRKKATKAQKAKDARDRKTSSNTIKAPKAALKTRRTKKASSDRINVDSCENEHDAPTSKHRPARLSFSSVSSSSDSPSSLGRTPSYPYRFNRSPGSSPPGITDNVAEELLGVAGYKSLDDRCS